MNNNQDVAAKHHKLCNPTRHQQRDAAVGYKTLCDGNRACPFCEIRIAWPLTLNVGTPNEIKTFACQPCYENGAHLAKAEGR